MDPWKFISEKLENGQSAVLLYVLESRGSSPGRQGFKMVVAEDGEIAGTIGGGIMELKLVERAKALLEGGKKVLDLKAQYHDREHPHDRSGLICSGEQKVATISLDPQDRALVERVLFKKSGALFLTPSGLEFLEDPPDQARFTFSSPKKWQYIEWLVPLPVIHIFGAGHVGLALSELMHYLGFYVILYDDREDLNTLRRNSFAHEKHRISYLQAAGQMRISREDYVVIMTFGYRSDKEVLLNLLDQKFAYIGMMGSDAKIAQLKKELEEEGIESTRYAHVKMPIGLKIYSQKAREIAVSIAAEIILERNKDLPSGRK